MLNGSLCLVYHIFTFHGFKYFKTKPKRIISTKSLCQPWSFLIQSSVAAQLASNMDMASHALCCFLCHEMVHFTGSNHSKFSNHMATKHKAFFNMELSLAVSLMDEKERQMVIRKQIIWKHYIKHEKRKDKKNSTISC